MVNMKNVTLTEPQFLIEKKCDRCLNTLYFNETILSDAQTDAEGNVLHSSIVCPVCGNVIVLYTQKDGQPAETDSVGCCPGKGEEPKPNQDS